jgi:hypothetical protein
MGIDNVEELTEEKTPKPKPKKSASKKSPKNTETSDVTLVAEEVLAGRWGNGRDRDERLKRSGHDPDAVRKEAYRIRGERIKNPTS